MYVNNFRSVNSNNENIMQHEQTNYLDAIFLFWVITFYLSFDNITLVRNESRKGFKKYFLKMVPILESVQDFLIKLDIKSCMHLVEISIFH